MVITDSGRSRQIDITPARMKMGIAGAVIALILAGAIGLGIGSYWKNGGAPLDERDSLVDRVKVLEEELRNKELALAVQKKRLEEFENAAPAVGAAPAAEEGGTDSALSEATCSAREQ